MRKNGSYELTLIQSENYFSPYGCQRADLLSFLDSVIHLLTFSLFIGV